MSLIKRNQKPVSMFDPFADFDNLFRDVFRAPARLSENGPMIPATDIHENDDAYTVTVELPGVNKDDVHVTLDGGVLSIEAETRKEDKEEKDGKIIRQERSYGKYLRRFSLGDSVNEEGLEANFKDGLLSVKIPKVKEEKQEPRKIQVGDAG